MLWDRAANEPPVRKKSFLLSGLWKHWRSSTIVTLLGTRRAFRGKETHKELYKRLCGRLDYTSVVVYQAKELEKKLVSQINTRAFFIPQVYNKSLYKFKVMARKKELNYFSSQWPLSYLQCDSIYNLLQLLICSCHHSLLMSFSEWIILHINKQFSLQVPTVVQ